MELLERQIRAALSGPSEVEAVKALIKGREEELLDCQEELQHIFLEHLRNKYWQGFLTGVVLVLVTVLVTILGNR